MSNHPNLLKIIITSKQKKKKRTEQSIHDLIKSKEKKKDEATGTIIYIYIYIFGHFCHLIITLSHLEHSYQEF